MNSPAPSTALKRRDLIELEPALGQALARLVPFTAHSLYFPAEAPAEPQWIARERTLLLPLRRQGELLGVFMARGVDGRAARRLLPSLPALVDLCLDNVELARQTRLDALTGLALPHVLLERMSRDADTVRARFAHSGDEDEGTAPLHRVCAGLVTVRCSGMRRLAVENGYAFADSLILALAQALVENLPGEALAARTGDDEFTLLLPSATRAACRKLASAVLSRLDDVALPHPVTRQAVRPRCVIGHALYPQDMEPALLPLPMPEQARILLHKARLAAAVAQERFESLAALNGLEALHGPDARSMAFGRVLAEGGVVRRLQPMGRVLVSLGRHVGAAEGQRFSVWGLPPASAAARGALAADAAPEAPLDTHAFSGAASAPGAAPGAAADAASISACAAGAFTGAKALPATAATAVSAARPVYKGEVVLLNVRDTASAAEVLHLADPAWPLEAGDTLALLSPSAPLSGVAEGAAAPETSRAAAPRAGSSAGLHRTGRHNGQAAARQTGHEAGQSPDAASGPASATDETTGLLCHGDFLRRLAQECPGRSSFTLTLVRLTPQAAPDTRAPVHAPDMALTARLCREVAHVAGGRYGEGSLAFLHDGGESDDALAESWRKVCAAAARQGLSLAVGLASYPVLSFHKGEMLECCRKALDLALLLPHPQVGQFGSLALNISADKRYSQGDVFGAVEEYQLALLADAGNALAWNSLGVCMAALSRQNEARRYFQESLKRQPHDASTLYNLGNVCQSLGETRAAARYYRQCVKADAEHVFAHIRLGQLAENAGRRGQAREYYAMAAQLEDAGSAGHGGLARRHLARVALRQRKSAEARELLHEALLRNPQDAAAMEMLAQLYLDGDEDPSMAEMLARKNVGLRPGHRAGWQLLARALRALGREADARAAEARAG